MNLLYILPVLLLTACAYGGEASADPTERGLSYVAGAIITAAFIRAVGRIFA